MKYPDAGINPAKSGLTARAGLYFKAGLHDKGDGFNLQDLDPYLLFDAETSMLGNLENPTLDLDPATPDTLDVITATRAGIATFTAADGQIVTADENTVRVDWSLGYPAMLIEPSATNLVGNSTSFTTGLDLTQETDIDAPDGTNTATRLIGIQAVSGERSVAIASSVTPSTEITGSVYLRGTAGEVISTYTKRHAAGTYAGTSRIDVTLTGDWQRVDGMTFTLNADNNQASIAIVNSTVATADTIDVWGAQIEEGTVSTSYIPTSGGSVAERTRNADYLIIDGTNFSDFFNDSEGTIYYEFVYDFDPSYNYIYCITQDSTNEIRAQLTVGDDIRTRYTVANSHIAVSPNGTVRGSLNRHAYSYKTDNFRASINGSVEAEVLTGTASLSPIRFQLGGRGSNAVTNLRLKRLLYWPTHSSSL